MHQGQFHLSLKKFQTSLLNKLNLTFCLKSNSVLVCFFSNHYILFLISALKNCLNQ